MDIIQKYFPEISKEQYNKLKELKYHYEEWNQKINVISRKDIENFYERHVLHSLAIAKVIQFNDHSQIIDVGTVGGFPGIPLAILFPKAHFTLLDSIGKKLKVIDEITQTLDINNVKTIHSRVEDIDSKYDYILSRAVTNLPKFLKLTRNVRKNKSTTNSGIYYLKGGDFEMELKQIKRKSQTTALSTFFEEDFFATKKIIHIPY
ncbi:MAG: 16S rRNA (guanine(527)-N(7))-methyltransferase RsmG [Crocinitomicaceae bacterium]|nr:16S rRNA (guanine(527)-N(7))-methyltransferase RsmG [Crocinitomicaceae bacterium]